MPPTAEQMGTQPTDKTSKRTTGRPSHIDGTYQIAIDGTFTPL